MSYAYNSTNNLAEFVDDDQQSSSSSSFNNYSHLNYPSSPAPSSSMNVASPSAFSFPENQIESSVGPSMPNRVVTRGQRKAAAAINVSAKSRNRSQTSHSSPSYPLTPGSNSSISGPSSSAVPRELSASPALSSISSQSQSSHRLIQQPQYRMSMSPVSPTVSHPPTAYSFHLPGPQLNSSQSAPAPSVSSSSVSRPYAKPKQRKQRLFNVDRKAICEYHLAHPTARQEFIAKKYGVERSTISKILKQKERWLSIDVDDVRGGVTGVPLRLAKLRPSKFPPVEFEMQKWLEEISDKFHASLPEPSPHPYDPHAPVPLHGPFSDAKLRDKARAIARSHGITPEQFKASSGWVENFKHRHGIRNGFWSGYLRNVRGRSALAASSFGLGYSPDLPPPSASPRHIASNLKPVSQEEQSDTDDEDDEDADMHDTSYRQPPSDFHHTYDSTYSRSPWSAGSSSTSTSGDSLMNPRTSQGPSYAYDRPPWSSGLTSSHRSTHTEPPDHYRRPRRSASALSVDAMDLPSSHTQTHSVQDTHMSHDVHHAQDKSHPQYQVQVHYGADPNQIYSYTTTVEHDSRSGHPAYSSEYPSSNLRQETSQDDGVNSYAHQSGSLHAENSSHVEYNHNMENIHHDAHMQTVIDPLPPPPLPVSDDSMPTLAECEVFLTKLSFFANKGPGQGILTLRRREWLRKLKVAFFEAGSGIPITPDSDEEAE